MFLTFFLLHHTPPFISLLCKQIDIAKKAQSNDFPEGIPVCGADALRFGLLAYTTQGRDVNLDIKRVVGYRQFCNKLWNAVRFALTYVADFQPSPTMHNEISLASGAARRDVYILSRLNATIKECNTQIGDYNFGATTMALHSFFLYDVCDVYLELIKPVMYDDSEANAVAKNKAQATLYTVLETYLRLAHPLMPFVTEELWQRLPNRTLLTSTPSIMISKYPEEMPHLANSEMEANMEMIKNVIHSARSLRSDYKVANHLKADFYFRSDSQELTSVLLSQADDFCTLARGNFLKHLEGDAVAPKGCCVKVVSDQISLLVDLTGIIDIDTEILRLTKEKDRLLPFIDQYKRKVTSSGQDKVPENVRKLNEEKLASYEAELEATIKALEAFQLMK